MNKRIAAAFCAAVMAVCAAGCGTVEVTNRDGEVKAGGESAEVLAENTAEEKLTVKAAAQTVTEKLEEVTKAANGELDGGYISEVTFDLADDEKLDGKSLFVKSDVKQKDKITGAEHTFGIGSDDLLTVQAVYDNSTGTGYAVFPDLSDAVLTGTTEEVTDWLNESVGSTIEESTDEELESFDLEKFKEIDFDALAEDIRSYGDTFLENLPEGTDGEDYTVTSGGVSFTLKTKNYTVTADKAKEIGNVIADKGRSDTQLKNVLTALGVSESDYSELWDDLVSDDAVGSDDLDVYYYNDETVGFSFVEPNSNEKYYIICVSDEKNMVISAHLNEDNDADGLLTLENDVLNGSVKMTDVNETYAGKVRSESVIEYKDLKVTSDELIGEIVMTVKEDGSEKDRVTYSFNTNADGGDISINAKSDGDDLGTLKISTQKTDASDIKIPSGTLYKVTDEEQLQAYLETCDVESWQEKVKASLGDSLYDDLCGTGLGTDDYDDDYDYDDYGWDKDLSGAEN